MPGVRDEGLVASAIGRPYTGYYRPIARKAAALVHSRTLNHGFVDGNKRTAVYVLGIFLVKCGYRLRFQNGIVMNSEIEDMVVAIADHQMDYDDVVEWLKERLEKV
jgi:death-on-curing protein